MEIPPRHERFCPLQPCPASRRATCQSVMWYGRERGDTPCFVPRSPIMRSQSTTRQPICLFVVGALVASIGVIPAFGQVRTARRGAVAKGDDGAVAAGPGGVAVKGEEGYAAAGRRGAVVSGEEGYAAVGKRGNVVTGDDIDVERGRCRPSWRRGRRRRRRSGRGSLRECRGGRPLRELRRLARRGCSRSRHRHRDDAGKATGRGDGRSR